MIAAITSQPTGAGAVRAKPIQWESDGRDEWTDPDHGFHIERRHDEPVESRYIANWGEGDSEGFDTLEAAQEWCQDLIDAWVGRHALVTPQPAGGEAVAWRHPDEIPEVTAGSHSYFWVAVRRKHDGRIYSFPAQYLNKMLLCNEWSDDTERSGNRYHHGKADEDEGSFPATGWHTEKEHGEYEGVYSPLLDETDELVAWREVANHPDTTPPAAQVQQEEAARDPYAPTDSEALAEFMRVCREAKPGGQWPGERVCAAIERLMANQKPFRFIAEADMAPERGHNGRGGDADRTLSGPRRVHPAAGSLGAVRELQAEIDRLNAIINTPQADDFLRAVSTEAEHQRQRWGSDHDTGKMPADWFWLIGYLSGKALHAQVAGNMEKAEHHVITTAAGLANWHRAMLGQTNMRPGIDGETVLQPPQEPV